MDAKANRVVLCTADASAMMRSELTECKDSPPFFVLFQDNADNGKTQI